MSFVELRYHFICLLHIALINFPANNCKTTLGIERSPCCFTKFSCFLMNQQGLAIFKCTNYEDKTKEANQFSRVLCLKIALGKLTG